MSNDLDLLFECAHRLEERRRAVLGDDVTVIMTPDEDCALEKFMHGDFIDAESLDKFARIAGFLHNKLMEDAVESVEGYTFVGGLVGAIEESVLIGIMWEKERVRRVRAGEMTPKVSDD